MEAAELERRTGLIQDRLESLSAQLENSKGDKTALLLGPTGDGLRVRCDRGLVAELGVEIGARGIHRYG